MADVLSITANIAGSISVGIQLAQILNHYATSVESAQERFTVIANDINLTLYILKSFAEHLKKNTYAKAMSVIAVQTATSAIDTCQRIFREIEAELERVCDTTSISPISKQGPVGSSEKKPGRESISWPCSEPKLEVLRAELKRAKSTLQLLMSVVTYAELTKTNANREALSSLGGKVRVLTMEKDKADRAVTELEGRHKDLRDYLARLNSATALAAQASNSESSTTLSSQTTGGPWDNLDAGMPAVIPNACSPPSLTPSNSSQGSEHNSPGPSEDEGHETPGGTQRNRGTIPVIVSTRETDAVGGSAVKETYSRSPKAILQLDYERCLQQLKTLQQTLDDTLKMLASSKDIGWSERLAGISTMSAKTKEVHLTLDEHARSPAAKEAILEEAQRKNLDVDRSIGIVYRILSDVLGIKDLRIFPANATLGDIGFTAVLKPELEQKLAEALQYSVPLSERHSLEEIKISVVYRAVIEHGRAKLNAANAMKAHAAIRSIEASPQPDPKQDVQIQAVPQVQIQTAKVTEQTSLPQAQLEVPQLLSPRPAQQQQNQSTRLANLIQQHQKPLKSPPSRPSSSCSVSSTPPRLSDDNSTLPIPQNIPSCLKEKLTTLPRHDVLTILRKLQEHEEKRRVSPPQQPLTPAQMHMAMQQQARRRPTPQPASAPRSQSSPPMHLPSVQMQMQMPVPTSAPLPSLSPANQSYLQPSPYKRACTPSLTGPPSCTSTSPCQPYSDCTATDATTQKSCTGAPSAKRRKLASAPAPVPVSMTAPVQRSCAQSALPSVDELVRSWTNLYET